MKTSPTKADTAAEEPENKEVGSSIPGFDTFQKYINHKDTYNWKLGEILIRNGIKDPKTGNEFYINNSNQVLRRGGKTALNKTQLTELLREKYTPGFSYK